MRVGKKISHCQSWDRVSVHDSFESGRAALALYDDGTKNPGCHWKREPGGSAQRIIFACSMHLDCGAKVRLVAKPSGSTVLERLRNVEHSNEINEYDRANAALTREQKGSFREAKRYGGTATDIMKNHQVDELAKLQKAAGGKRKVCDDAGVEGARPGLERISERIAAVPTAAMRNAGSLSAHSTALNCMRLHAIAFVYIHTHTIVYAYMRIRLHANACVRIHAWVRSCVHAREYDCIQMHATACNCMRLHVCA
jgi:hypothetical protein